MVNDILTAHTRSANGGTARPVATKTLAAKSATAAALALCALAMGGLAHADGHTMPDVTGKGLVEAFQALDYDTGIQFKDGRGAGRHVLWPSSWKVCDQTPAPGTPRADRKVTLTVVKDDEQCGSGAE
ncbi:PASTA domain-containing protein [Streptomyces sp. NPDC002446]